MAFPLVRPASDFVLRRRRAFALFAAAGITSYAAYSAYNHPIVVQKRQRLARLLKALVALTEALNESADTVSLVVADLGRYLRSDSDEIPASIKQISKIACSDEVSQSVARMSGAVASGVVGAVREAGVVGEGSGRSSSGSIAGEVMDKVFSPAGTGFVSVVAGSVARGLVAGACSTGAAVGSDGSTTANWASDLLVSENSRKLMADCIQQFVSTAVTTYLDRTMQVNTYDEMLAGLTNPKHEAKVKDVLVSVCNGAVETLVRTSHQVITAAAKTTNPTNLGNETQTQADKDLESPSSKPQLAVKAASPTADKSSLSGPAANSSRGGGAVWVDGVSSTLSVPSNRRFVLDVTGRVTFETVRSILDFFLSRLYDCSKLGVNFVHREVVRKGIEVLRYVGAKSMLILAACLSVCLQLVFGSKLLVAA